MGVSTYFVTVKFAAGGKNFINHLWLGAAPIQADLEAFNTALEELTVPNEGDPVATSGGHVISITKSLQRILAAENRLEVQDLAAVNCRLLTGRLERFDTPANPDQILTIPFILRGVNPAAIAPPLFDDPPGANYRNYCEEFLKKYTRVQGSAPTMVTIARDVLMH